MTRSKVPTVSGIATSSDGNQVVSFLEAWIDEKSVANIPAGRHKLSQSHWYEQLSNTLHVLHEKGIILGSINQYNVIVDDEAEFSNA